MELRITWQDEGSKGYTDVIPLALFANDGESRRVQHGVTGPKGGSHVALCDILTKDEEVYLNYGPYESENRKSQYSGILRLTFDNPSRKGVPKVAWKGGGDKTFKRGDVSIALASEGDPQLVQVFGTDALPVHAHFSVEDSRDLVRVTLESRGGTIGAPNERNRGYSAALLLLLQRMAAKRLQLIEAALASRPTPANRNHATERRLTPIGFTTPLFLSETTDTEALAKAIQRASGDVASNRKVGRGNTTRRLELILTRTSDTPHMSDLTEYLSYGSSVEVRSEEEPDDTLSSAFDPSSITDARTKTLTAIAVRRGQQKFRKALIAAYGSACAVTGDNVVEVLEAAHIVGYLGDETNHIQNGLLLRADIHTLFDLRRLSIDPRTRTVVLHSNLREGPYANLHGTEVKLPSDKHRQPSEKALLDHLKLCGLFTA